METQANYSKIELMGAGLAGAASAIAGGYLARLSGRVTAALLCGGGYATYASIKGYQEGHSRRWIQWSMLVFGAALLGASAIGLREATKGLAIFLRYRDLRGVEGRLMSLGFYSSCVGLAGYSTASAALGDIKGERWAKERFELVKTAMQHSDKSKLPKWAKLIALMDRNGPEKWIFSGPVISELRTILGTGPDLENVISQAVARAWSYLSDEEKEQIILQHQELYVPADSLVKELTKRGYSQDVTQHVERVKNKLSQGMSFDQTLQEVARALPYNQFEEAVERIERDVTVTEFPTGDDRKRWARGLQPIHIFYRIMISPDIKKLGALGSWMAATSADQSTDPLLSGWAKFKEFRKAEKSEGSTRKMPSLMDRAKKLIDQVHGGGKEKVAGFADFLATLTPQLASKARAVDYDDQEDDLMDALIALMGTITHSDREYGMLQEVLQIPAGVDLSEAFNQRLKALGLTSAGAVEGAIDDKLAQSSDPKMGRVEQLRVLVDEKGQLPELTFTPPQEEEPAASKAPSEQVKDSFFREDALAYKHTSIEKVAAAAIGVLSLALGLNHLAERIGTFPKTAIVGGALGLMGGVAAANVIVPPLLQGYYGLQQVQEEVEDVGLGRALAVADWVSPHLSFVNVMKFQFARTLSYDKGVMANLEAVGGFVIGAAIGRFFGRLALFPGLLSLGSIVGGYGAYRLSAITTDHRQIAKNRISKAQGAHILWRTGWVNTGLTVAMGREWMDRNPTVSPFFEGMVQQQRSRYVNPALLDAPQGAPSSSTASDDDEWPYASDSDDD